MIYKSILKSVKNVMRFFKNVKKNVKRAKIGKNCYFRINNLIFDGYFYVI